MKEAAIYGEELRELRVNRFKIVDKEFNILLQAAEHLPELTTLYVGEGKVSPASNTPFYLACMGALGS